LPPSGGRFKWLIAKGKEPLILYTLLLWRRVNLEQLKAPPVINLLLCNKLTSLGRGSENWYENVAQRFRTNFLIPNRGVFNLPKGRGLVALSA